MADPTDQNDDQKNQNPDSNVDKNQDSTPDIDALVAKRVEEALKPIKENLDKAYSARDEALKKVKEFERLQREAELKRLQEEGRHKEAYEMQLRERDAEIENLKRRNIELTRDIEVRNALAAYPFRNDNALEMAYREIVSNLIQDDKGNWVHKNGLSIRDFVKSFVEHEDNAFLLKPKANSGSGSTPASATATASGNKSLFQMSQAEVLKLAKEGKLPRR
jgi:hypothetical protein